MKNRFIRASLLTLSAYALFGFAASPAFAQTPPTGQTLGDMTNSVYDSLVSIQMFLSVLSYILGAFFTVTGLQKMRNYIDDPSRNPPFAFLLRLGAATFFLFAPTLANYLVATLGGQSVGNSALLTEGATPGVAVTVADATGTGLDGALLRFVMDLAGPFLDNLLPIFCFIAGLALMIIGLKRMALANGEGPQAPGGAGTMGTFLVAAMLLSFGYVMYAFQESIFGKNELFANQVFKSSSLDPTMQDRAQKALYGVFIFLRIVGYISVLRGLFILRTVAEGGQASMMQVGTHMVAGSLLANSGAFVDTIQNTFLSDQNDFVFTAL